MLIFFKLSAERILFPKKFGKIQFRFLDVYSMKSHSSARDFQSSSLLFSWKFSMKFLWRIFCVIPFSYSTPLLVWWAQALPLRIVSSCITLLLSDTQCSWKGVQQLLKLLSFVIKNCSVIKNKYFGINSWNNCFHFFSAIFCAILNCWIIQ